MLNVYSVVCMCKNRHVNAARNAAWLNRSDCFFTRQCNDDQCMAGTGKKIPTEGKSLY